MPDTKSHMGASVIEATEPAGALRVQVVGPGAAPLPAGDLARLFPHLRPSSPQAGRLAGSARIEIRRGGEIVGLAVCLPAGDELRVPALAVGDGPQNGSRAVLHALVDALEAACLADGHRRLIITPPASTLTTLARRGYDLIREGCAGTWVEKRFA